MSNTEKIHKYTINCINSLPVVFIARPNENNGVQVVMIGITKEQETKLINNENIIIETDRGVFNIIPDLCYVYGNLNLSPDSSDIETLRKGKIFNDLIINIAVPSKSEYDYKTHSITSNKQTGTWYNTHYVEDYLPYLHGCIGKPERIVIFKEYLNSLIANKIKRERNIKNSRKYRENKTDYSYYREKTIAKRKAKVSSLKFKIKK